MKKLFVVMVCVLSLFVTSAIASAQVITLWGLTASNYDQGTLVTVSNSQDGQWVGQNIMVDDLPYLDSGMLAMMKGEFVGNCRGTVQGNDTCLVVPLFHLLWFKFE